MVDLLAAQFGIRFLVHICVDKVIFALQAPGRVETDAADRHFKNSTSRADSCERSYTEIGHECPLRSINIVPGSGTALPFSL